MRIDIITSVPELLTSPLNESILKRAQDKGLVEIVVHNLHDYAHDRRKTTDDYPFGGEAGMVMKCEPVFELVEKLQSERPYDEIIYTSPDGIRYDQHEANRLSTLDNLISSAATTRALTTASANTWSRARSRSATTCSRAASWPPASSPIR